jgi:hypothetical protein
MSSKKAKKKAVKSFLAKNLESEGYPFNNDYVGTLILEGMNDNIAKIAEAISGGMVETIKDILQDVEYRIFDKPKESKKKGSPQFHIDIWAREGDSPTLVSCELGEMIQEAAVDMPNPEEFADWLEMHARKIRAEHQAYVARCSSGKNKTEASDAIRSLLED